MTATRGERGEVIPESLGHLVGDGPALAAHRSGELAAALAALGVTDHAFLDTLPAGAGAPPHARRGATPRYEDSGMVWLGAARAGAGIVPAGAFVAAPIDEAVARLAGILRARRPAVVVTYDPDGGYGHPDHVRVHQVTMRAVAVASSDDWQPAVWWRRTGRSTLSAGYLGLRSARVRAALGAEYGRFILPDPDGPFPSVAAPDEEVGLTVDVTAVRDRLLSALRAYPTQVQAVRAVAGERALAGCYALSDRVLQPLLPDEGYVQVDGPSVDLPAHVRWLS